jgi:hypothetical protein
MDSVDLEIEIIMEIRVEMGSCRGIMQMGEEDFSVNL